MKLKTKCVWSLRRLRYFVFKESISRGFSGRRRDGKHLKSKETIHFIYLRLTKNSLFCLWVILTSLELWWNVLQASYSEWVYIYKKKTMRLSVWISCLRTAFNWIHWKEFADHCILLLFTFYKAWHLFGNWGSSIWPSSPFIVSPFSPLSSGFTASPFLLCALFFFNFFIQLASAAFPFSHVRDLFPFPLSKD